ncbi:MAG: hypothetical protein L0K74_02520 [Acidipropionibacterium acidipropionici]|nr:hypothetical protein [Acidipropionibacterium acidipropionici]
MALTLIIAMVLILLVAVGIGTVVWTGLRDPKKPVEGSGARAAAARWGRVLNGDDDAVMGALRAIRVPVSEGRH